MTFDVDADIVRGSVRCYGVEEQEWMAVEELSELTTAISHARRDREGAEENLVEEIADAVIGIANVMEIHRIKLEDVDRWINLKQTRLEHRMMRGAVE